MKLVTHLAAFTAGILVFVVYSYRWLDRRFDLL
jgi:hypothetical protein